MGNQMSVKLMKLSCLFLFDNCLITEVYIHRLATWQFGRLLAGLLIVLQEKFFCNILLEIWSIRVVSRLNYFWKTGGHPKSEAIKQGNKVFKITK